MGVYIDIEMPRCCADCAFFVQLAGSDVTECVMPEGRVGQWCPLEDADRKTEPQTNADQHVQRVEYVGNVKRCRKCKHIESEYQTPISSDGKYYTYVVCTASECRFEPKDEPQYDAEEVAKDINRRVDLIKREWEVRHTETNVETMSCEECKHWIFTSQWGWFCPLKGQDECHYEPIEDEPQTEREGE